MGLWDRIIGRRTVIVAEGLGEKGSLGPLGRSHVETGSALFEDRGSAREASKTATVGKSSLNEDWERFRSGEFDG